MDKKVNDNFDFLTRSMAVGGWLTKVNLQPINVIFNDPATIVFWTDGTKTVVKCSADDEFDKYKGFVMAYLKKSLGSGRKAERFVNEHFEPEKPKFKLVFKKELVPMLEISDSWAYRIDGMTKEEIQKNEPRLVVSGYWFVEKEIK